MSQEGRLQQNILQFARTLRRAGLPVGTGQILDAIMAVAEAGVDRRDDFYWALRSVLATDPSHFRVFDQAFHIYFRNPRLLERMISMMLPSIERQQGKNASEQAARRLVQALQSEVPTTPGDDDLEVDRTASYSAREILRHKDFEQMSVEELAQARQLLRQELLPSLPVATRRFSPHPYGRRYDMRQSMRQMLRNNGQLIELRWKRRQQKPSPLVLIADISGSMSQYSRVFLQFAHVLRGHYADVSGFVFGTRLTNISRHLEERDVDRALEQVSAQVLDWDGGTRIGDCIRRFNVEWGRRVLARNGVVILLSDGLERESDSDLSFEMQRLKISCKRLIWLNPMLRYAGFEAKAQGIRAMLPHVDEFLPAHNVQSLLDLAKLLGQRRATDRRAAA